MALLIEGESGIGKSALVRRFTEQLEGRGVVVLAGRCYEREAVRYKAVDGVVDALSRYMARLPDDQAAVLLPRSGALLGEVFPVLCRVKAIATAPRPWIAANIDPQELRSRLFAAMRELVGRLADRHPLVVVIDDLQWGDADSLALLGEVLRPPETPAFLLVATMRLGAAAALPEIARYMPPDVRQLSLGRLSPTDARELVARLLERMTPGSPAAAAADEIVAEADGHPLFIDELVRHAGLYGAAAKGVLRLDDALRLRVAALEPGARRVLELIAIAGRPLAHEVVRRAAALEPEPYARHLGVLRVSNLVQGGAGRASGTVAPYHDRVREAAVAQLGDDERRARHADLAVALEQSERPDSELLAVHWRGAGDDERAAEHSLRAASGAEAALAFDRAARLYRAALELRPADHPSVHELLTRLGRALASAGRGAPAADAYSRAEVGASPAEILDLRRFATTELIRSGHLDEGLDGIRTLAGTTGVRLASKPRAALVSLLVRRGMLRVRGYGFRTRDASQVTAEQLRRIDFCWWVAAALGGIDTVLGADLNTRALLMALRAGEPLRLVRALGAEALFVSMSGGPGRRRAEQIVAIMDDLARQHDRPEIRAFLSWARGVCQFYVGEFGSALSSLDEAEQTFSAECRGVAWELDSVRLFKLFSMTHLGRIGDLSRRAPQLAAEALDRGDLYAATNFRLSIINVAWLAGDDVKEARRTAREALQGWSPAGVLVHTWFGPTAEVQLDLYEGHGSEANARITGGWRALERSLILRLQNVRSEAHHLRARSALAAAREDASKAPRLLREAERDAKRILRERMPWSNPLAELILAGVAASRGERETAARHCAAAAAGFDAAEMALYAAAARRRHGELLGGDEGRALVAAADAWMTSQRIRNPARWTAMVAPGFPD